MTFYLTFIDPTSLSRTVLEIMPVKVLKAHKMAEFDLLKVEVISRFFSNIEKAPPLTQ